MANESVIKKYHKLLVNISSQPLKNQADALQRFILKNPDFESAYFLLLQRFLLEADSVASRSFFQKLLESPKYQQLAFWALANFKLRQSKPILAAKLFARALSISTKPNWELFRQTLSFNKTYPELSIDNSRLSEKCSTPLQKKCFSALRFFYQANYKSAVATFSSLPALPLKNHTLRHLCGLSFFYLRNYQKADSVWKMGADESYRAGNLQTHAFFLEELAKANYVMRNHEAAKLYYDSSAVIATSIGDFDLLQLVTGIKALDCKIRGQYPQAVDGYKKAIRLATKLQLHHYLDDWYLNLGEIFFKQAKFDEALEAYKMAQKSTVRYRDIRSQLKIQINIGDLYYYFNQIDLAKSMFQDALKTADKYKLSDAKLKLTLRLVRIKLETGQQNIPKTILTENIAKISNSVSKIYWLIILAELYLDEKEYEHSKAEYLEALAFAEEINYQPYIGWLNKEIAYVDLKTGKPEVALTSLKTALKIAESLNHLSMKIAVFRTIGEVYQTTGDFAKAIKAYKSAIEITELANKNITLEPIRIGHFDLLSEAYTKLSDCYYQKFQQTKKAFYLDSLFYFQELASGRSLKNLFSRSAAENTEAYQNYKKLCQKLRRQQRKLREKAFLPLPREGWDDLVSQTEVTRYSLMGQQLNLSVADSARANRKFSSDVSLAKTAKMLRSLDAGLLMYHISDETAFALVVTPDTTAAIPLPTNRATLDSAVQQLMTPFHRVDVDSIQKTPFAAEIAYHLYQALLQPLESTLPLPKRLIIIPDLAIVNVPFGMLLDQSPQKSRYYPGDDPAGYAGHFLQQRYSFAYSPSTTFLRRNLTAASPDKKVLAVANPFNNDLLLASVENRFRESDNWFFLPLPYAEKEAEAIKTLHPATQIYRRDDATKAVFLAEAPQYDILHIASHGFVNTTFDAFSGLVFAMSETDTTDDGLLMGYEIANLKLNCDLVTLSACETGQGKLVAGEGVLGLPRLFLNAGSRSVLMTLWKVDDYFTSQLMPAFYAQYLKKGLPKIDALAAAKRALLAKSEEENNVYYQHPLFWASFTLFGDPGQKNTQTSTATSFFTILILFSVTIFSIVAAFYWWRNKQLRTHVNSDGR